MLVLLVRPPTCLYQILVVMLWVFPSCGKEKLFMRIVFIRSQQPSLDVLIVVQDNFQQRILTKERYINVKMQKHDGNWNL